jgi:sulfide dehydrogenase cytochrome subunit
MWFLMFFALASSGLAVAFTPAAASEPSPALSWNCNGCHGFDGVSEGPLVPSIAGMNARLFFYMMRGFQLDERPSTIMGRIAKGYRVKELRAMASYFERRPWRAASATAPVPAFDHERAVDLHDRLCAECHDDQGRFQDKEIPRLAGQWPAYLGMMLTDYRDADSTLPQPEKMRDRIKDLTDEEINLLSLYYAQVD